MKIHDEPDIAREVEMVKEIVSVVAEPLVIDELSLIRAEPVRVQIRCRNPDALKGEIEFFFNGDGVFLKFEVEEGKGSGKGPKVGLLLLTRGVGQEVQVGGKIRTSLTKR